MSVRSRAPQAQGTNPTLLLIDSDILVHTMTATPMVRSASFCASVTINQSNLVGVSADRFALGSVVSEGSTPAAEYAWTSDEPATETVRQLHRIQWEPDKLWRQDTDYENGSRLSILYTPTYAEIEMRPGRFYSSAPRFWWQRRGQVASEKVRTLPFALPIVAPKFPEAEWRVSRSTVDSHVSAVRRVKITRRASETGARTEAETDLAVWSGLDEYEYVEDEASGLVREFIGYSAGGVAVRVIIDELRINEPIAPAAWSLERRLFQKRTYGAHIS